jgi:hypothetical protein
VAHRIDDGGHREQQDVVLAVGDLDGNRLKPSDGILAVLVLCVGCYIDSNRESALSAAKRARSSPRRSQAFQEHTIR